jgi:hypothetical protein
VVYLHIQPNLLQYSIRFRELHEKERQNIDCG